ncbi:TRAP-type C4-dicarboxylate transport system [Desulfocucumis palustris]|uniref:TRAP-type C4-dicarboxylate transport system n=2 Tax=Desulfocucumis palustris TaxID=1898651 RepID=A0A2L2X8P5_9FIRM|nr:TRAP-type C4-dicarboxylate transport system [Desulfocucumis palustris]
MKRVEELSNGRVKFEFYPAEQLGKAKDMLNLVRSGTADMTYVLSSLVPGELPLSAVGELPLYTDTTVAAKAFRTLEKEVLFEKEIKRLGVRPIIDSEWSQCSLFTTKPIKSVEDLKGMKIAAAGGRLDVAKSLGGVPVSMSAPDTYEALSKGIVQGAIFMFNNAESYKIQEVAKYAYEGVPMGGYMGYYFMNEKTWQKLPEDIKEIIAKAGIEASDKIAQSSDELEKEIMEKWEKSGSVTIYHIPTAEKEQWTTKINKVNEDWAKNMDAKNLAGSQTLDAFKKALEASGK